MANNHHVFEDVNEALIGLCDFLERNGEETSSRAGLTREATFQAIKIEKPWRREILIPERRANVVAQIAETAWVLAGRNDVDWLEHYLPRAADFSDDGKTWRAGYGPRLRRVSADGGFGYPDPLVEVIRLLKEDPNTRRAVVSLWDWESDYQDSKDVPCNNWLHFLARDGGLDLHVATRSNDLIWGWSGINQFEWSVLLELVAECTGLFMGSIHYSVSSLHMYERHFERAGTIKNAAPTGVSFLRGTSMAPTSIHSFDNQLKTWFYLEECYRTGREPFGGEMGFLAPLTDPLLLSWMHAIRWYWTGDGDALEALEGTRLHKALSFLKPKQSAAPVPPALLDQVCDLHKSKHEVYGDSWKKRGQKLGVMANIARKVDRLGLGGAGDTNVDTAMDLLCYLVKYRWWLVDHRSESIPVDVAHPVGDRFSDFHAPVEALLRHVAKAVPQKPREGLYSSLRGDFEQLWNLVEAGDPHAHLVDSMITDAFALLVAEDEAAQKEVWARTNHTRRFEGYERDNQRPDAWSAEALQEMRNEK